jgi:restriction endonuclease
MALYAVRLVTAESLTNPNERMPPIFDQSPATWEELQDRVAQLFAEVGCGVEIGKVVQLVRGDKEIDVLVQDPATVPKSTYLCECKFWSKAVPKEIVHAFRTVVSDFGAHRGFIISKAGFQEGAFEAAKNTNIDLMTFDQVQALFFDRWKVAMGKRYRAEADVLFPYWDYPGKMPKIKWTKEHSHRQDVLTAAYRPLLHIGPWFEMQGCVWDLPMTLPTVDADGNENGTVTLSTYRQVYDFIERSKDLALKQFQMLYGEI